jgi:predicted ATP-grasp superfamily ATP-dependent carboligase
LAKRLRILFTEGASLSARQTLYPLGPHHDIDVLDPNPLCQCRFSSYVRRFIRSPSFTRQPVEFLRFVMGLIRGGNYDVLLPTHEQTYLFSRFRDAFTPHVGIALPEFASQERLQNKAEFSRLLDELNLPQPESTIVRTRAELGRDWQYPFYLKLAHSTAGGGVFYIQDQAALSERIDRFEADGLLRGNTEVLVQQPARGVLSTVQAVFNRGELCGIHCFEARRLGVGGMSTARTSADHAIVREHVTRIGKHLAWHGAFFIDYFYDNASGRPEYIEANPRIGETVNALLAGVNMPQLLVQISLGETPPPARLGRFGVRTHNSLMILMSLAYEGASRLTLVRELRRFRAGDEPYCNGEDELTRPREDRMSALPFVYTTAQLLAWPHIAKRIVAKTVGDYSLPAELTEQLRALPLDIAAK